MDVVQYLRCISVITL